MWNFIIIVCISIQGQPVCQEYVVDHNLTLEDCMTRFMDNIKHPGISVKCHHVK